jgi:hypothetical protein
MSVKQVDRMGDLLSCMQDVLDTADGDPQYAAVDVGELTGLVLEGMSSVLREWGGAVVRVGPSAPVYIYGDAARTERAIRAAIRALVSISVPGGTIWVSVGPNEGHVEVKAEQKGAHGKTLSFTERLCLSLVETNIRNQGGSYACVDDPLCIGFTLPAYSFEATDSAFAQDCVPAHVSS